MRTWLDRMPTQIIASAFRVCVSQWSRRMDLNEKRYALMSVVSRVIVQKGQLPICRCCGDKIKNGEPRVELWFNQYEGFFHVHCAKSLAKSINEVIDKL